MDEAGHILCGFNYCDLIGHARPWKPDWWRQFLTVNCFYPPAVYVTSGVLKLVLGPERWVDQLLLVAYDVVLTLTVFGTAMMLTGRRLVAFIAASVVNLYPVMAFLSRTYLLDFQIACMVSLGVCSLVWWRRSPTWRRAAVCGLALTLACLTKQVAAAFLAGPGLYYLIESVLGGGASEDGRRRRLQLVMMAVTVALVAAPWVIASRPFISEFAATNQKVIGSTVGEITVPQALVRGIGYYTSALPRLMSPLLLIVFLASIVAAGRSMHAKLAPVMLSSVGGILLISLLPWQFPADRYAPPALLTPAVYSGVALAVLFGRGIASKALAGMVMLVASAQFASYCFAPYPIDRPRWFATLSQTMGLRVDCGVSWMENKSAPMPARDWGHDWVLSTIEGVDPGRQVWLNVLPNHVQFNPHTFTLRGKALHSAVRPTSSRTWTVMGDTVAFSPESALYYDWFLFKTGDQGHNLLDAESEERCRRLIEFVSHGGRFRLVGRRAVPDGSELLLYRQKSPGERGVGG